MRLREWPYWNRWKAELVEQGHRRLPDDEEIITFELLANFNDLSPGFANGALAKSPRPNEAGRARRGGAAGAPSLRRRDMGRKGGARWGQLMDATTARADFANESPLTKEAIASIRTPTLAVYGELSHCLPSCRQLEKLIPRTHVAIIPGAGHFHPAVKPLRFTKVLGHFLREHPGASEGRALPRRRRAAAIAARSRQDVR
jgi:pimeloyl-ACP methyl ester carboxylesterase